MHVKIHFSLFPQCSKALQNFLSTVKYCFYCILTTQGNKLSTSLILCTHFSLSTDRYLLSLKHWKKKKVQHLNVASCYILFNIRLVWLALVQHFCGNKWATETLSSFGWIHSEVHHVISFFSFFSVFFHSLERNVFVLLFDSCTSVALSVHTLCLLFCGFSSLMYSIHGLYVWVAVAGGGCLVWWALLPACLCEPLSLPCVCQCVLHDWTI